MKVRGLKEGFILAQLSCKLAPSTNFLDAVSCCPPAAAGHRCPAAPSEYHAGHAEEAQRQLGCHCVRHMGLTCGLMSSLVVLPSADICSSCTLLVTAANCWFSTCFAVPERPGVSSGRPHQQNIYLFVTTATQISQLRAAATDQQHSDLKADSEVEGTTWSNSTLSGQAGPALQNVLQNCCPLCLAGRPAHRARQRRTVDHVSPVFRLIQVMQQWAVFDSESPTL